MVGADPGRDGPVEGVLPIDPDSMSARPLHRQLPAMGLVFLGGIIGTGVRYGLEKAFPVEGTGWPWATFVINLSGAFILGALLEMLVRLGEDDGRRRQIRLLVGTGVCGSYTTYSTFAEETTMLLHRGAPGTAIGYGVSSVVLGVICAWLGVTFAAVIARRRVVGDKP